MCQSPKLRGTLELLRASENSKKKEVLKYPRSERYLITSDSGTRVTNLSFDVIAVGGYWKALNRAGICSDF